MGSPSGISGNPIIAGSKDLRYRWFIISLAIIITMTISIYQYSWSLFAYNIRKELDWSLAEISLAFTIFQLANFSQPFAGAIADARGPRGVGITGALLVGLGFLLSSQVSSPGQLLPLFGNRRRRGGGPDRDRHGQRGQMVSGQEGPGLRVDDVRVRSGHGRLQLDDPGFLGCFRVPIDLHLRGPDHAGDSGPRSLAFSVPPGRMGLRAGSPIFLGASGRCGLQGGRDAADPPMVPYLLLLYLHGLHGADLCGADEDDRPRVRHPASLF